jgi:hypothetical protein
MSSFISAPIDPWTYFPILALAVGIIAIIGLLLERKSLMAKAAALTTSITGVSKVNQGSVSNEFHFKTGAAPAPGPAVIQDIQPIAGSDNVVNAIVLLPNVDKNGLPLKSMTKLHLYAMEKSFLGELENLVGLEPHTTVDVTPAQFGTIVTVQLALPKYLTDYYFYAVPE